MSAESAEINNLFLSSLSASAGERLVSASTEVELPLRTPLYEAEEMPKYAYFITSGIASVVTVMRDGGTAEVGLIGHEGLVGSFHLLGPARSTTECFIQLEATALRIPLRQLEMEFRTSEEIRDRVLEFVQSLGQLAGCHRLHEAEERLARWLLMAQDRVQSDELNFTQEFLAMMLGSRRTTVTVVAGELQRKGLIDYRRGRVRILNRKALEEAACDCYQIIKRLYVDLYKSNVPVGRGAKSPSHSSM
jgi:CRP-like cAMP-binding protein